MPTDSTLVIHEIYASIQGESTFAGLPCTFVRVGSSRVDLQACKLEYSIVSPK